MKAFLGLLLILVPIVVFGKAQTENFLLFNTGNNLLQHNTVETIVRDKLGYVWIGTNFGLYRLDSYKAQSFLHNDSDSTSISSNFVKSLFTDSKGDLWVGTIGGGLNRYNRELNQFEHFLVNGDMVANVTAITEDNDNNIWVGTTNCGVNKIDRKNGKIINFQLDKFDPMKRKNSNVFFLHTDKQGNIWAGLNQGEIYKIETRSENITYHGLSFNDIGVYETGSIKGIAELPDGTLLFATWNSCLYCLNPMTDQKIRLLKGPDFFNNALLSDVKTDLEGNVWVSTWEKGLFKFSSNFNQFQHITHKNWANNSLGSNAINKLYIDNFENLWICTLDNGLSMLPLKRKMFSPLELTTDNSQSLNTYAFCKDGNGNIWIGTRGQGLFRYNPKSGEVRNYNSSTHKNLKCNSILSLKTNSEGKIWVGTDGCFVLLLDPEKETFTQIDHLKTDWSDAIFCFAESKDYLFGGTWGGGIKKIDKKTLKYTDINFNEKDQYKNSIFDLELNDSILWVANVGLGLIRYNIINNTFKTYPYNNSAINSPSERITDLYFEKNDLLWISTDGGGLYQFTPSTDTFLKAKPYGFNSKVVQSTLADNKGNIWATTNSGVSVIDRNRKTSFDFSKHNGLLSNQMNKSAMFYDNTENTIYIGSVEGVNYFNPSKIHVDSVVNRVVFTDLFIMGNPLGQPNKRNLSNSIDVAKEVHLYPKEKIVTFQFSSMEFTPSARSCYYYMLEGFNNEWIRTPYDKNFIQYTNLNPGKYILRIKSCNSDGVCNNQETSLKIIVHPSFWQTIIFKILIVALVVLLIMISVQARYARLMEAKHHLEVKIMQRTEEIQSQKEQIEKQNAQLEQANNTKDKFFSIISHDLKNPMSSINQLIEVIISEHGHWSEERMRQYLLLLKKTSEQTLGLLDDLLVWARTQTNRIQTTKVKIELGVILSEVFNICQPIAKNKSIELKMSESNNFTVYADRNTLITVLRNLVTNSIKFSHPKSEVRIEVLAIDKEIVIKVIDRGIGMNEKEVSNLFKIEKLVSRKGTSGELGSGLGLILCKEFITLNNGKIWVESERGIGSTFFVSLPKNS